MNAREWAGLGWFWLPSSPKATEELGTGICLLSCMEFLLEYVFQVVAQFNIHLIWVGSNLPIETAKKRVACHNPGFTLCRTSNSCIIFKHLQILLRIFQNLDVYTLYISYFQCQTHILQTVECHIMFNFHAHPLLCSILQTCFLVFFPNWKFSCISLNFVDSPPYNFLTLPFHKILFSFSPLHYSFFNVFFLVLSHLTFSSLDKCDPLWCGMVTRHF